MASLVLVVISIVLMSALAVISVNYVPADALVRQQIFKEAQAGLESIEQGVGRYLNSNRDLDGNIIYPGDGVNLVSAFSPNYGYLPPDVHKEMTWEVVTGHMALNMPAVGICLKPVATSTAMQQATLTELQTRLPVGATFVSTGCQATSNTAGGTHLTYWLPLSHIN